MYPDQIDSIPVISNNAFSVETFNLYRRAILAIQKELGTNPSGHNRNVSERLSALEAAMDTAGIEKLSGNVKITRIEIQKDEPVLPNQVDGVLNSKDGELFWAPIPEPPAVETPLSLSREDVEQIVLPLIPESKPHIDEHLISGVVCSRKEVLSISHEDDEIVFLDCKFCFPILQYTVRYSNRTALELAGGDENYQYYGVVKAYKFKMPPRRPDYNVQLSVVSIDFENVRLKISHDVPNCSRIVLSDGTEITDEEFDFMPVISGEYQAKVYDTDGLVHKSNWVNIRLDVPNYKTGNIVTGIEFWYVVAFKKFESSVNETLVDIGNGHHRVQMLSKPSSKLAMISTGVGWKSKNTLPIELDDGWNILMENVSSRDRHIYLNGKFVMEMVTGDGSDYLEQSISTNRSQVGMLFFGKGVQDPDFVHRWILSKITKDY